MAERVAELIEKVRAVPSSRAGNQRLASMLRQGAPHFGGLSAGEADQVRGHILASFELRGLPMDSVSTVKEELRTSFSPIVLAGAARALRGLANVDPESRALLVAASERLELRDEVVRLDGPDDARADPPRTARGEIASTLARLDESRAPCCCGSAQPSNLGNMTRSISLCPKTLGSVFVEDQSEQQMPLLDLLQGRTSLIAFFYTRCMNPAKCSLTISRLAELAGRAVADGTSGLNFLAISYDPDFDVASRLRAYGKDRGFPFDWNAKLVRCTEGWSETRRIFDLQVGYSEATVNAHARELFVVTRDLNAVGVDCEQLSEPSRLLGWLNGIVASPAP